MKDTGRWWFAAAGSSSLKAQVHSRVRAHRGWFPLRRRRRGQVCWEPEGDGCDRVSGTQTNTMETLIWFSSISVNTGPARNARQRLLKEVFKQKGRRRRDEEKCSSFPSLLHLHLILAKSSPAWQGTSWITASRFTVPFQFCLVFSRGFFSPSLFWI